ncbi:MAG: secretin N-terminal domain-containing protein, partial [Thermodesulfovibrionales bacterium]
MKKGEVSFNFDDADVFSVIQTIFGDVLKVNYIVDPSVKGRVNFRSTAPVAKEDVMPLMEVILRLNGIGVVEEGGLYRIVPIADISKEPSPVGVGRDADEVEITGKALVQVVPIKYVQSSEMVRVLTPFLSKNAVIIDVPKSNYIIISDTDANVKRLLELVEIFDSEELKAVTPQVYVYAVQNGKAKDVAALLQQIFLGAKAQAKTPAPSKTPGQPQKTQPVATPQQQPLPAGQSPTTGEGALLVAETTRIIADEITNSIIILATPEDYALIEKTLTKVDIAPRQVILEGLIVQVTLDNNLSFGL